MLLRYRGILDQFNRMWQYGFNKVEIFDCRFWAAGKIDNKGFISDASYSPGKHGMFGNLHAFRANSLNYSGGLFFQHSQGRLRGDVAGGKACATRG